jgi:DNA mismatch endonuclease (patch repair protein)
MPTANRDYWEAKIGRNVARDRRIDAALTAAGWRVVRIWQHVPTEQAAEAVGCVVASQSA